MHMQFISKCTLPRIILLACTLAFFISVNAQKGNLNIANWKKISARALEIKDWETYKNANYALAELDPDNDTTYNNNILHALFQSFQHESCFLFAKKLLATKADNVYYLDYYARSADILRRYGDAFSAYEKLESYTGSVTYAYLAANTQYALGRYNECLANIERIKNHKDVNTTTIEFTVNEQNQKQHVPISAALLNLKGMVYYELKKFDDSMASFSAAVNLFPEFTVAKENLKSVQQEHGSHDGHDH